jgi:hypothetical protein
VVQANDSLCLENRRLLEKEIEGIEAAKCPGSAYCVEKVGQQRFSLVSVDGKVQLTDACPMAGFLNSRDTGFSYFSTTPIEFSTQSAMCSNCSPCCTVIQNFALL